MVRNKKWNETEAVSKMQYIWQSPCHVFVQISIGAVICSYLFVLLMPLLFDCILDKTVFSHMIMFLKVQQLIDKHDEWGGQSAVCCFVLFWFECYHYEMCPTIYQRAKINLFTVFLQKIDVNGEIGHTHICFGLHKPWKLIQTHFLLYIQLVCGLNFTVKIVGIYYVRQLQYCSCKLNWMRY